VKHNAFINSNTVYLSYRQINLQEVNTKDYSYSSK